MAEKIKGKLEGTDEKLKSEPKEIVHFKPLPLPVGVLNSDLSFESPSSLDELSSKEFIPGKALGGWGEEDETEEKNENVVFSQNIFTETVEEEKEEIQLVKQFINKESLPSLNDLRTFSQKYVKILLISHTFKILIDILTVLMVKIL